jgi:hypothetical protein
MPSYKFYGGVDSDGDGVGDLADASHKFYGSVNPAIAMEWVITRTFLQILSVDSDGDGVGDGAGLPSLNTERGR